MMSLVRPPQLIRDPEWERAVLGPSVARARRTFARGVPVDPRPTLIRAYHRVPFYQGLFRARAIGLRDLHDRRVLGAITITRRDDLASGIDPFLVHPIEPFALERGWLGRTSGSTGQPIPYLRDPRTLAWFWAFLDHVLATLNKRADARPVVMLDALEHMPEYDSELPLFHGVRYHKRNVASDLGDPQIITGDPESLAVLTRKAVRPQLVMSSAFAMPAVLRDEIERATGAPVIEYYASQETSVIALRCRAGAFHPLPGACHLEVVDGEVVVTPVNNPSFVLIRYAPGDLAEFASDRCACGVEGLRLTTLAGRTHVRFSGARGPFSAGLLAPLLARLPVLEHQLAQRGVDRYTLRYRGPPLTDAALIERRLAELAGCAITLELAHVDAIPRRTHKPEPLVVETVES